MTWSQYEWKNLNIFNITYFKSLQDSRRTFRGTLESLHGNWRKRPSQLRFYRFRHFERTFSDLYVSYIIFFVILTEEKQRYPAAAAPAKPKDEWDYEGEFWTSWYNTDTPSDEIEDETLQRIQTRYRKDFQEQKKNYIIWEIISRSIFNPNSKTQIFVLNFERNFLPTSNIFYLIWLKVKLFIRTKPRVVAEIPFSYDLNPKNLGLRFGPII